jgi:hypothetical protein
MFFDMLVYPSVLCVAVLSVSVAAETEVAV